MKKLFLILTGAMIYLMACAISNPLTRGTPTAAPKPTANANGIAIPTEEPFHLPPNQTGKYKTYPPSSGVHYGNYLEWGLYKQEVPPEYWVHSLEHGGIVILFNCKYLPDCDKAKSALETFWDNAPPDAKFGNIKILITPNSKITNAITALAWGYQLDLTSLDESTLLKFYLKYVNQGPELVP